MSHLFKNENKKYYIGIKFFIFSIILYIFISGLLNYSGNVFIYILFSIVSNYLIIFSFRKNAIFFDTFFGLLLWLGFWFKFSCTISFTDGIFREGTGLFDYSATSFDETLIISQVGILAFIFAGYIREYFLFKYPNKINQKNIEINYLKQNRKKIWFIFLVFFITVGVLNLYFKIYQKGLLPVDDYNFIISGIFKWLLLFGLSSFSSLIIFLEFHLYKIFFVSSSLVIFFENFVSYFSMLSRGMIFNSFALLFGIYKFSKKTDSTNLINYYLKMIFFIFILFYISVSSVNYIRANYFYSGKASEFVVDKLIETKKTDEKIEKRFSTISEHNSEFIYLIINRWVGIDAVMAVNSKKEMLNSEFFFKALKEEAFEKRPTFYEINFGLKGEDAQYIYEKVKGNTLPGVIAFIYYYGSYKFLFLSILLLSLFASFIEFAAFKASSNNLIFSALIGHTVAYRFIHFGYLPSQSYLLFGSIFLTIILFFLFMFVLEKFKL